MSEPVKKLNISNHQGDKTLQMANAMKQHPRLGIYGLENREPLEGTICVRNATEIHDDQSFAGKLTNHRYFYGSRTVRNE